MTQADPSIAPPPTGPMIGPSWAGVLGWGIKFPGNVFSGSSKNKGFYLERFESRACSLLLNAAHLQKERMKPIFRVSKEENLTVLVVIQSLNPASSEAKPFLGWAPWANRVPFWMKQFKLSFYHLQLKEFWAVSYCHLDFTERGNDAQRS